MVLIAYWDLRGLIQPTRVMAAYTGYAYEYKEYITGDEPPYDKAEWLEAKFNLGLDFPNLPYLEDGDVKLTQSIAIHRYVARKSDPNLLGRNDTERAHVDMLLAEWMDFRSAVSRASYSQPPAHDALMETLRTQNLPPRLEMFAKYLGDKTFLLGDNISAVDFCLYECLELAFYLDPQILAKHANLSAFRSRIAALPGVSEFIAAGGNKRPFNNRMAKWGQKVL